MFIKVSAKLIKGQDLEDAEVLGKDGDWYIGDALINVDEIELVCDGDEYVTVSLKSGQSIDIYMGISKFMEFLPMQNG